MMKLRFPSSRGKMDDHSTPALDHAGNGHNHGIHGHSRDMEPASEAEAAYGRAFAIGVALNLLFVLAEAGSGFFTGSLALIADAGHNTADVLGLVLGWAAVHLGRRRPSTRHTYGLKRSSILASLINAIILLIGVGAIALAAVDRLLFSGPAVVPGIMIAVSLLGIAVNGATAMLFHRGHTHDLNIRAAFLHMASDAFVSAGVAITGVAIAMTHANWLDPVAGLLIAIVITFGTWSLLRDSLNLALDAVPTHIDPDAVADFLRQLPGVTEIHDFHIWPLSTTDIALSAHLVRPVKELDDELVNSASRELQKRFGIGHATIQIEHGDAANPCGLVNAETLSL